jgi:hypothetical protein
MIGPQRVDRDQNDGRSVLRPNGLQKERRQEQLSESHFA